MAENGSIAIVTGGSRGLGRDTVLRLAERGVRVILTYNANRAAADEVVRSAGEAGAAAVALPLDVGRAAGFAAFADAARDALRSFGSDRFHYLVNNAGTSSGAKFVDGTEAQLDEQFAVHFKAPFLLSQALLPLLAEGGRIVNVSSGLARFSYPGRAIYGPMKAAVESLTRYMAQELGPRGITVNTVAPGAIATDFSGGMVRDNPEIGRAIAAQTALGRVGQPSDVGKMIAALLSDDFGWVTGQRIEVSGGVHL